MDANNIKTELDELLAKLSDPEFLSSAQDEAKKAGARIQKLQRMLTAHEALKNTENELRALEDLKKESGATDEIAALEAEISHAAYRVEKSCGFDAYRISGDLLASAMHLIRPRTEWVEVPDYTNSEGGTATIAIDPTLSPSENVESYYRKYRKGKATWEHALEELHLVESKLAQTRERFGQLLSPIGDDDQVDLKALESFLHPKTEPVSAKGDPYRNAPGLRFISGAFTILVGRNAKENEELLRRWARGNDWWMHTRDVPGGYVFIKSIAGKTIPLETLLDAGNLAVLYSKAKDAGKADLYYTQVKFLKRPKGGKAGLVLPTQEKNLTVQLDEPRVKRLFSTENEL